VNVRSKRALVVGIPVGLAAVAAIGWVAATSDERALHGLGATLSVAIAEEDAQQKESREPLRGKESDEDGREGLERAIELQVAYRRSLPPYATYDDTTKLVSDEAVAAARSALACRSFSSSAPLTKEQTSAAKRIGDGLSDFEDGDSRAARLRRSFDAWRFDQDMARAATLSQMADFLGRLPTKFLDRYKAVAKEIQDVDLAEVPELVKELDRLIASAPPLARAVRVSRLRIEAKLRDDWLAKRASLGLLERRREAGNTRRAWEANEEQYRVAEKLAETIPPPDSLRTAGFDDELARAVEARETHVAILKALRLALAVIAWRKTHDRWPRLEDLGEPKDPGGLDLLPYDDDRCMSINWPRWRLVLEAPR
jgi:hypothetical protein